MSAISALEPPAPVAVPRAPFVVLVLLVVVGGVLGILLLNTKINENAFVLHELRQQQALLDQREQQLEQEIAQVSSTAQLAAAARQLGLVDRRDDLTYLRLPDDGLPDDGLPDDGLPDDGLPDDGLPDDAATRPVGGGSR